MPRQPTEAAARRADRLASVLDTLFRVPGTRIRFGLDPLLGLIPGVGDATGAVLSAYLVLEAVRSGASGAVLVRMLLNVGIDALLSSIPLLGDLLDAGWKANTRNLALLQRHLADPGGAHAASRGVIGMVLLGLLAVIVAGAIGAILAVRWLIGLVA